MNRSISALAVIAVTVAFGAAGASAQSYTKRGQGTHGQAAAQTNVRSQAAAPSPVGQPRVSHDAPHVGPSHHGHWQRYYEHERRHRRHWYGRWW